MKKFHYIKRGIVRGMCAVILAANLFIANPQLVVYGEVSDVLADDETTVSEDELFQEHLSVSAGDLALQADSQAVAPAYEEFDSTITGSIVDYENFAFISDTETKKTFDYKFLGSVDVEAGQKEVELIEDAARSRVLQINAISQGLNSYQADTWYKIKIDVDTPIRSTKSG